MTVAACLSVATEITIPLLTKTVIDRAIGHGDRRLLIRLALAAIALGRPGATGAQIQAAARAIGAEEFIEALPGGYSADVGKRGSRLSAGQRQLISFARAFLAAPAVLVLDEATSLLDIPSERLVQAALRTILVGRTAVIIAHRLSTVQIADRVLVLERGRITEDGPPAQRRCAPGEML